MRLAYGAVQRSGTLEHVATSLAGRPAGRLDPPVLAGLRLGLYELLYLRGSPDHAVVDDVVELVKQSRSHGHGLVNAVLRRAAREGRDAARGAQRGYARGRRRQALSSRLDRATVVAGARSRAGLRPNGPRQRAERARAAREYARLRTRGGPRAARRSGPLRPADPRGAGRGGSPRPAGIPALARGRGHGQSRAAMLVARGRWPRGPASACSTCARAPAAKAPTSRL